MRVYEVRLLVKAESITTVLDVVKDSADLISMTQVSEPEGAKRKRATAKRHRAKGLKASEVILQRLKAGPAAISGLEKEMRDGGFSITSARVAANDLIRGGKVKKSENGIYELA